MLELIKSYLSGRKQKVRIDDKSSEGKIIGTEVPQGRILGSLFFIIYMNDLLIDMTKGSILSYADDTDIIADDNTWSQAQARMNVLLDKVSNWFAFNKLSLNISKTNFLTFGNYRDTVPVEILKNRLKKLQELKTINVWGYLSITI